ncbi:hypothetical protein [Salegentibacter mishustinae]|uniref:hypothetical protein n=1 Tax=Salegentibacter mishustinae TaxID=270918 RepID=UPI0024928430|nr:hypothetical protein [Salegentibacter mishustinae]
MKKLSTLNVSELDTTSMRETNGGIIFPPHYYTVAAVYTAQAWEDIKEGAKEGYEAAMN